MTAELRIRRVVLAIDTVERNTRFVREAFDVASHLEAELEGLFIEDDALLRLSDHSFARRIGSHGTAHELSRGDLEREWRVLAGEVHRTLAKEAERRRVRMHFAVARGTVESALRERLSWGDVVVAAWGGFSPGTRAAGPVRVMYDAGKASLRALELGVRLAKSEELLVWIIPDSDRATSLAHDVRERVRGRVGRLRLAGLSDSTLAAMRKAVADEPGGFLIVPADHELATRIAQRSPAARFPCTVVIAH